jgi:CTP synthase
MRKKISLFCNVRPESVIEERDVAHTIYEVPLMLRDEGIHRLLSKLLGVQLGSPDLAAWERIVDTVKTAKQTVEIAVVGKYIELNDAYKSIYEAIGHAAIENGVRVKLRKLSSDKLSHEVAAQALAGCHGILVPGGFGGRGIEGKILAVRTAREQRIPFLGLCYGLHMAVIEFARHVCGLSGANSTEIDPNTPHPVIALLDEQQRITDKGGTMRLGSQPCRLLPGRARTAYGKNEISERHRHRYEVNNAYRAMLTERGMAFTGLHPKTDLVEIAEIPDHPWFVSVQYHPEFKSKPTAAHPLFRDFVKAALARARGGELPREDGDPGERRSAARHGASRGKRGAAAPPARAPAAGTSQPRPARRSPGTGSASRAS